MTLLKNQTRLRLSLFAVLLALPLTAQAQENPFMQADQALKAGNRLAAVSFYKQAFASNPAMQGVFKQYLPLISDYEATTPYAETKPLPAQNKEYFEQLSESVDELVWLEAIPAIVEMAKDRQIVILNEAHDAPQHRAFGLLLAKALRRVGFEFMAMETLVGPGKVSGVVEYEYPTLETGFYSGEPIFADFVRQCPKLGYQMIAYEIEAGQRKVNAQKDPNASIKERENAQSDNLIKHVLQKHKDAKLFVYVGYSHATEDWQTLEDGSQLGWMAAQIQKKTGIDPLTIDQVGGSYNPKSNQIDPVFKLLQSNREIIKPSIVKGIDGAWLSADRYFKKTDLSVFHPVQKMIDGRPNWLRMQGYRKSHMIDNADYFVEPKTLVQAYFEEEGDDALPVDQILLDSAEGDSTFLLPAGNYRTEMRTINGEMKKGPSFKISSE